MHQVSFPGHAGQPCIGHYAIAIDRSGTFARADIVLVRRHGHEASLLNGNESGIESPTELGILALATLAQSDPVASFLRRTQGKLGPDHTLEF